MPFLSMRDLEREAELLAYGVLDEPPTAALQQIVEFVSGSLGIAVAEINVVTATETWHLVTSDGRGGVHRPRQDSICGRVVEFDGPTFVMTDARTHPLFREEPYVTGEEASLVSYAGTHLLSDAGVVIGTLCVYDFCQVDFTDEQVKLLEGLARSVVAILRMHRANRELAGTLGRVVDSHRALNTSHESLEAFAGQISHDLQTPLTAVSLALELIAEQSPLDGDLSMLVGHALSSTQRMQRAITDLLDFAIAGDGSEPVPVDLNPVVRHVLADLGPGLSEVTVQVAELPVVLGHESELRSVLQNLVTNAVKYSAPHGAVFVEITAVAEGGTARVVVADNGPGVPETERDRVFDLFARAETGVEGHGIGLATCARIIQARGGAIGVAPSPSGGAAFWFEVPLAP